MLGRLRAAQLVKRPTLKGSLSCGNSKLNKSYDGSKGECRCHQHRTCLSIHFYTINRAEGSSIAATCSYLFSGIAWRKAADRAGRRGVVAGPGNDNSDNTDNNDNNDNNDHKNCY